MSRTKIEKGLSISLRTTGKPNITGHLKRPPDKGGLLPIKGKIPTFNDGRVNIQRPFEIPLPKLMPVSEQKKIPLNLNKGNQKRLLTKAKVIAGINADKRKPVIRNKAGLNGIDIAKSRNAVPNAPAGHRTPKITHMGVPAKGVSYRQSVSPAFINPDLFAPIRNKPPENADFKPAHPDRTNVINTPSPVDIKRQEPPMPSTKPHTETTFEKTEAPNSGMMIFAVVGIAAFFMFRG